MEILGICLTVMSLCLTAMGVIGAYVWKTNSKLQRDMMQALERIEEGQKEGFKVLSEMLFNQTKILERIEGKIPAPSVG